MTEAAGFKIAKMRMVQLSKADAERFYGVHAGRPFFETLTTMMSSGRVVAMELVKEDAIQAWRDLIGPTDSAVAREEAKGSIRARFGVDKTQNACHGSDAPETAAEECAFFFGEGSEGMGQCFTLSNTTLGLIKPHLLLDGCLGAALAQIQEHFEITAAQVFAITTTDAADFLEVYRGVVPASEFHDTMHDLASGPFCAVEVSVKGDPSLPACEGFRELCGPRDPELARLLRPDTLRARFGKDKVKNAVHCTDLEEDSPLEVEYFFKLLASVPAAC